MLPVTLGLGLINVNLVIDSFFAVALHRPAAVAVGDRRRVPRLHAPAGDVLRRDRDRALPGAGALLVARRLDGFRATVATGLRQIAFLLVPASVVSAVLAEPIIRLLYQRGDFTPGADAGRRRAASPRSPRADLQRRDADAQPRVLLAPVELGADRGRARQPRVNAALDAAVLRFGTWGIPLSTTVVTSPGPRRCSCCCAGGSAGSSSARRCDAVVRVLVASAAARRGLYGVWRVLDDALGRSIGGRSSRSAPPSPPAPPSTSSPACCCASASSTRSGAASRAR